MECFHSGINCYKLSTKYVALNSWLILRKPSNNWHIHVDKKTSRGTLSCLLPYMVTINYHSKINFFPPWINIIWRNWFNGITMELFPVSTIIKNSIVDYRIGWVKGKTRVVFLIQICHNMQGSHDMFFLRVGKKQQCHWDFGWNFNVTNLNNPPHYSNQGLKVRGLLRVKCIWAVNPRIIFIHKRIWGLLG